MRKRCIWFCGSRLKFEVSMNLETSAPAQERADAGPMAKVAQVVDKSELAEGEMQIAPVARTLEDLALLSSVLHRRDK
jgi:hypothetical protein